VCVVCRHKCCIGVRLWQGWGHVCEGRRRHTCQGKMLGGGLSIPATLYRSLNSLRSLPSSVWKYRGRSTVAMLLAKTLKTSVTMSEKFCRSRAAPVNSSNMQRQQRMHVSTDQQKHTGNGSGIRVSRTGQMGPGTCKDSPAW
jgi:hypothetical protein